MGTESSVVTYTSLAKSVRKKNISFKVGCLCVHKALI